MEAQDQRRRMWHRYVWRFFTGLHLDGKRRKTGRGSVLPQYSGYFWNRYSRGRRAFFRNLMFWITLGTSYGLLFDRKITEFVLLAVSPFVLFAGCRKLLDAFTQVVNFSDTDGVTERYRIVRPKIRRWIGAHKPIKNRVALPDGGPVPPDVARAILADNMEENGEPILQLRQFGEVEDVTGKTDSRSHTITRKHSKK